MCHKRCETLVTRQAVVDFFVRRRVFASIDIQNEFPPFISSSRSLCVSMCLSILFTKDLIYLLFGFQLIRKKAVFIGQDFQWFICIHRYCLRILLKSLPGQTLQGFFSSLLLVLAPLSICIYCFSPMFALQSNIHWTRR